MSMLQKKEYMMNMIHYYRLVQTRQSNQRPFDETVCDALITNSDVIKPSKKMQNVCDGSNIKHGSYKSCMCDEWQMVNPEELFTMMQSNRNGQPYEGVCDIRHTVH